MLVFMWNQAVFIFRMAWVFISDWDHGFRGAQAVYLKLMIYSSGEGLEYNCHKSGEKQVRHVLEQKYVFLWRRKHYIHSNSYTSWKWSGDQEQKKLNKQTTPFHLLYTISSLYSFYSPFFLSNPFPPVSALPPLSISSICIPLFHLFFSLFV